MSYGPKWPWGLGQLPVSMNLWSVAQPMGGILYEVHVFVIASFPCGNPGKGFGERHGHLGSVSCAVHT